MTENTTQKAGMAFRAATVTAGALLAGCSGPEQASLPFNERYSPRTRVNITIDNAQTAQNYPLPLRPNASMTATIEGTNDTRHDAIIIDLSAIPFNVVTQPDQLQVDVISNYTPNPLNDVVTGDGITVTAQSPEWQTADTDIRFSIADFNADITIKLSGALDLDNPKAGISEIMLVFPATRGQPDYASFKKAISLPTDEARPSNASELQSWLRSEVALAQRQAVEEAMRPLLEARPREQQYYRAESGKPSEAPSRS